MAAKRKVKRKLKVPKGMQLVPTAEMEEINRNVREIMERVERIAQKLDLPPAPPVGRWTRPGDSLVLDARGSRVKQDGHGVVKVGR